MQRSILCLVVLALGLSLSAGSTARVQQLSALAPPSGRVDDPPPEPVECPMCGGNAQMHARRLLLIQQRVNCIALLATRW